MLEPGYRPCQDTVSDGACSFIAGLAEFGLQRKEKGSKDLTVCVMADLDVEGGQ